ncbi:hypothetical protein [Scytonema sp. PRP1]|uniref:hypothetical protein n=1 Tax=Scytonema sp. PRP1 TaxID=3120513 RepID=UPI002FD2A437
MGLIITPRLWRPPLGKGGLQGGGIKLNFIEKIQLMKRLGIHDVAGLVRYALRIGLLLPDT